MKVGDVIEYINPYTKDISYGVIILLSSHPWVGPGLIRVKFNRNGSILTQTKHCKVISV